MTTYEQLPDAWLHEGEWARVGGFYIYPRDDQFHIGRPSGARDYRDVETGFANMQAAIDHARWMVDDGKCSVPKGWICYGVDCGHSYDGGHPRCYHKYRCPTCGKHPDRCESDTALALAADAAKEE